MERVVEGRLQYLKMVKGETDSSYLKLKLLFESLKQNVKEKIADINYIATYAMEAYSGARSASNSSLKRSKRCSLTYK